VCPHLRFVTVYLRATARRVWDHLPPDAQGRLAKLTDPQDMDCLPRRRDFAMTCLDVLAVARVPEVSHM